MPISISSRVNWSEGAAIESVEEPEVFINRIPSKIFHDGDRENAGVDPAFYKVSF